MLGAFDNLLDLLGLIQVERERVGERERVRESERERENESKRVRVLCAHTLFAFCGNFIVIKQIRPALS